MSAARKLFVANRGEIAVRVFSTCRRLGIETRATMLKTNAEPIKQREIDGQVDRLIGTGAHKMGMLFKVMAIADPKLGVLPAVEA